MGGQGNTLIEREVLIKDLARMRDVEVAANGENDLPVTMRAV